MRTYFRLSITLLLLIVIFAANVNAQQKIEKPYRLIVLTDIEADPDDSQSMIRLMLYTNQIDIEGLIATTSTHQRGKVVPETIHRIIDAYGQVQANLLLHEPGYPTAEELHALVKQGLPVYGMEGVGEGKDSEGSEWIIRVLEEADPRPVWVSVFGGPNTLAQALWKISHTRSEEEAARLISKLRVYTISDQDDSGPWMRRTYPNLWYIVSPGSYGSSTWRAISVVVPNHDNETVSNRWINDNIQQNHGPLGAMYPDVAYSMEGDTPSYLGLIPNGLNDPNHPEIGGWGGRYELYKPEPETPEDAQFRRSPAEPETRPIWTNVNDTFSPRITNPHGRAIRPDTMTYTDNQVTLWRWRDDFQNDFAARMDWSFMSYEEANHPPVPRLAHDDTLYVHSGEIFGLSAEGTTDPDGDGLSYWWFQYTELGTYHEPIRTGLSENLYFVHSITAPEVDSTVEVHYVLKVTDKGTPPLSRYKRVVVYISPIDN